MTDKRQSVRDNARYLREVRPIDPEEIWEYVDGQPHPAVIRQILRESTVELGIRERDDGTFVPVEEQPISATFAGVDSFPFEYGTALEELLVEAYGRGWPDGESGDSLRETIRGMKAEYFAGSPVEYDRETALAYALYHLPDNYAVVQYVLSRLAEADLFSTRLRILDVGAGVGGPMLGVHDLLPEDALVEYQAVEPSAAADVFERFAEETHTGFEPTLHRETAEEFSPEGEFDILLFANVLSELSDPDAVAGRYMESVAPDGSLVGIAPADRETAIGLRQTERALERDGYSVWGPQVRLWENARPTDRGWSFDVRPDLDVPAFQQALDAAAGREGEFVNADVQYAFSVVRHDDERMVDIALDTGRFARFSDSESHVSNRVDCVALKLSHDLSDGGNPLYKVSDGSESTDHYAVLTRESMLNTDLSRADYGDPLVFENALLLWNDDEESYNLVVDDETVVDRAG
ncbi:small ribosomal subunit Rsm22 family protein [Halosegnis rubeus]|uniref:SAM-dependent methyltransferase n=1 Tax=Halosegnis rubeus TaxID=2212850 RepID=A0A5N5UK96_9EURY|nr:class I SAM-dependent methyltransferase [Halosegnis rubeus]KAB7518690.1 SAM-dependent methyltransferase [Halosegnis rubeus]